METYGLTDLGYSIFLDRYAQKGDAAQAKKDDLVLVVKDGGKRDIATIIDTNGDKTTVKYLISEETATIPRTLIDFPIETNPQQMQQRVARGIASVEQRPDIWAENFEWLLRDWKFVPAGRILTTAGTPYNMTCYNCYVIESPHDSRGGIMDNIKKMIEIMSHGGGVGVNLSSLRPQHAIVRGVNGRSSGPVSWGQMYSTATGLIEQAGSRRGALLLMLNDWHPDVLTFINSKRNKTALTNCNISVGISDAFMEAVKHDELWTLEFPDTSDPDYNMYWNGDLRAWKLRGKDTIVYASLKAREIWDALIESAWASAEPGLFFLERYNKMSNSHYYAPIIACNPCAEQGLPADGVCNLGALNLAKFVKKGRVDWLMLSQAVVYAVRFLDNVIDWTPYFYKANEDQQKGERRVGLGTMGLAEMMIQCGVRYGSDEGVAFAEKVYKFIAERAYEASALLAKEKGSFPCFDADGLLESGFMQGMDLWVHDLIREHGLRNVTLLTSAPTGTTGTMLNTSTGIEPFYSLTWFRQSRLGWAEEKLPLLAQFGDGPLPDYVVTAMQLSPAEHVKMQAAAQRWIDTSISKTVNVPADWSIEQVKEVYQMLYDMGCKGGTIYRDGSRSEQVLHLEKPKDTHTCPECGETVEHSTCDVACAYCSFMGCAV